MGVKFDAFKSVVVRNASRGALVLKKYGPEISFGLGLAGIGGTIFFACKATLQVDAVQQETKAKFDRIEAAKEDGLVYKNDEQYQKDKVIAWTQGAVALARLYAPAIGLGVVSVGLLTGSHVILRKRNTALMLAYAALDKSFREYKERIKDEIGEEVENLVRHGVNENVSLVEETDADGNAVIKEEHTRSIFGDLSPYAVTWNEFSGTRGKNAAWQTNYTDNIWYLQQKQNWCNDQLMARGHLFLNEVYRQLGFPETPAGQLVGWVWGHGDNVVDFGLNSAVNRNAPSFSSNPELILDFNVDGLVWNLI